MSHCIVSANILNRKGGKRVRDGQGRTDFQGALCGLAGANDRAVQAPFLVRECPGQDTEHHFGRRVTEHLRVLRDAEIVTVEKRGYFVHYRVNEARLVKWKELADSLLDLERK